MFAGIGIERTTGDRTAWIAAMRFGMGPKPGFINRIGWSRAQALWACQRELDDPQHLITDASLKSYEECCAAAGSQDARLAIHRAEIAARYAKHLEPEIGFVERLVLFWSNHFSMSRLGFDPVAATIGQLERDVIRQHVLGKFSDMLKGVMQHPAMLTYLNNVGSIGPNSNFAVRTRNDPNQRRRGHNEDLAREILELHTLGEGAPYSQQDVTNLALILTGWTRQWKAEGLNTFFFNRDVHEPGSLTVLGRTYATAGQERGLAVLDDLAARRETADHISLKLLVHFVTDEPTPDMVARLSRVFSDTGGDLKAVAEALLRMPEAWQAPLNRIRPPHLWLVSQLRALDFSADKAKAMTPHLEAYLADLGNQPWTSAMPDGFPDENYAWAHADAIRVRKDIVSQLLIESEKDGNWRAPSPLVLARSLSPSLLSGMLARRTVQELLWWRDRDHKSGLNLLFMSPEFIYR